MTAVMVVPPPAAILNTCALKSFDSSATTKHNNLTSDPEKA